ncbi:MAG: hypothetical protein RL210_1772 [Pseudomonadota bacterium]|jgi:acylglycerol lipase
MWLDRWMQRLAILATVGFILLPHVSKAAESAVGFSFAALKAAGTGYPAQLEEVAADDGSKLVYRLYAPRNPLAVLIFYHGSGSHGAAGYQHLARALSEQQIAVITPDIRGHGDSEGNRGAAPKTATVFDDVSNMIEVAQQRFADLPVYLGGHDSGAGLALNYQSYPQREVVDGLVLLAPDMGPFYDTRRAKGPVFSKIDTSRLLVNLLTAGKAMGTALGSSFAYPAELYMKDSKLISGHTMNMTAAVTPRKPKDQLAELTMPVGVWVGAEDEMIDPAKLTDLVRSAARLRTVATVPAETHFSLQLRAADAIGPWIREQALASK